MATIDDIRVQLKASVAVLDRKIYDAGALQAAGHDEVDQAIKDMTARRQRLHALAYAASLASDDFIHALAVLKTATAMLTTTAVQMVKATDFVTKLAGFLAAADSAAGSVKGT